MAPRGLSATKKRNEEKKNQFKFSSLILIVISYYYHRKEPKVQTQHSRFETTMDGKRIINEQV